MFEKIEVLKSGTRTADGEGSTVTVLNRFNQAEGNRNAKFYLNVSAASGTSPFMTVFIVATINGTDFTIGSFTDAISTGQKTIDVDNCPDEVKVGFDISGTNPSFTFDVQMTR